MAKMREFKVQGPDGKIIAVKAPEDATDQQIEDLAAAEYYKAPARPKVDLEAGNQGRIQILQSEYKDAIRRIMDARAKNDSAALQRAEGDRMAIAGELQRMGPNLIPGADITAEPKTTSPGAPSPAQSVATQARQMASQVDPTRALIDLAAATGGAGGSALMDRLSGGLGAPTAPDGRPMPTSGVQKYTASQGLQQRGGQTYKQAYQLEEGLRKGAKIGGIQPEFRFAKPPVIEPSMLQRTGQAMMASPKAVGGLGGLSMAESGMEAMKRMQGGDPIGAAIAGAGAVGGGLSMIPTIPTRVGGMALSAASPLTLYLYDKLRQSSPQAAEQLLQEPSMISMPQ